MKTLYQSYKGSPQSLSCTSTTHRATRNYTHTPTESEVVQSMFHLSTCVQPQSLTHAQLYNHLHGYTLTKRTPLSFDRLTLSQ